MIIKNQIKKINLSHIKSIQDYDNKYKSDHWQRGYEKKKERLKFNNIENFRNNSLSDGLDTRPGSIESQKKLYNQLKDEIGIKYLRKNLSNSNIGNLKNVLRIENKLIDPNLLFHIRQLYEIQKQVKNKNLKPKIICEIGAGFGSLSHLLIKNFKNTKYIIYDLPEANFLSSYYLLKKNTKKRFLFYCDIKNKKLSVNDIKNYDIIILPPWVNLKDIKVDIFINLRSFMEMDKIVIKKYFTLIQKTIKNSGIFININRYEKRTVGYPIRIAEYPYDNKWKVIKSEPTWNSPHSHTLIVERKNKKSDIKTELKKIKKLTIKENFKINKHFLKNILPRSIFLFLQRVKHSFNK